MNDTEKNFEIEDFELKAWGVDEIPDIVNSYVDDALEFLHDRVTEKEIDEYRNEINIPKFFILTGIDRSTLKYNNGNENIFVEFNRENLIRAIMNSNNRVW